MRIAHQRKKLHHLFIGRRRKTGDGNMHEVHAQSFGFFLFPFGFGAIFRAQIDDGGDSQFF